VDLLIVELTKVIMSIARF